MLEHELIESGAVQFGEFTLQSGQKSDVYVDCKRLVMNGRWTRSLGMALLARIEDIWTPGVNEFWRTGVLVGVAEGGIPLVAVVLGCSQYWRGGWVRKDAKPHGVGGQLAGCIRPGDRAILLEDVVTTGESTSHAIQVLTANQITIEAVVAIVDRHGGNPFAQLGVAYHPLTTLSALRAEAGK